MPVENRINRNIVECKCLLMGLICSPKEGINRNIVECKLEMSFLPITFKRVLIETLWNVNDGESDVWVKQHEY